MHRAGRIMTLKPEINAVLKASKELDLFQIIIVFICSLCFWQLIIISRLCVEALVL